MDLACWDRRGLPVGAALASALLLLAGGGCAVLVPRGSHPGPGALVVDGVPLRVFGTERCGAGSLSALLAFHGDSITQEQLEALLPRTADGVLSVDLLLAARDRGYDARLAAGSFEGIAESLHAGRPVILMLQVLDGPGRRKDLYHYAVADGIDAARGLLRLQLGDGEARWMPMARLARPWEKAGRALLEVRPEAAAGGDAAESLRRAVALEESGRLDEAAAAYRRLLATGPPSALAWTNLGNVEAARGRRSEAEAAYRAALALAPADPDALNNLAWLLLQEGTRLEEAEILAARAVEAGGPDPRLALDTLGHVLLARGRCDRAVEIFRWVIDLAPRGGEAERQAAGTALAAAERCAPPPVPR